MCECASELVSVSECVRGCVCDRAFVLCPDEHDEEISTARTFMANKQQITKDCENIKPQNTKSKKNTRY